MRLFLGICLLVVLLAMLGQSCGRAIEHELRPLGLSQEQRLEVMSRVNRPELLVADEENLAAYDRHLTRSVEEDWRAQR